MNLNLSQSEEREIKLALFQQLRVVEDELGFARASGERFNQDNWQYRKNSILRVLKRLQASDNDAYQS